MDFATFWLDDEKATLDLDSVAGRLARFLLKAFPEAEWSVDPNQLIVAESRALTLIATRQEDG